MARTAFFSDERCFWHSADRYAFLAPVGGLVQPLAGPGLPEHPEGKRRLKNLIEVTGLAAALDMRSAEPATDEDLLRVHDRDYIARFKALSDAQGGELGQRTPFGPGGFEIAALSAGLVKAALFDVLDGRVRNAYALSRPPGHHCLPATPMGFCLLANIAIAVEAARAAGKAERVAVVDWDVHHGNGTEAIFLERGDVLTVSLHQDNNYPPDSGGAEVRGSGAGAGCNINVPLPPGAGHDAYLHAFERIVEPALRRFRPDCVVVACGFDASGVDPLSRTLASAETFGAMTRRLLALCDEICDGRLAMAHEGGYAEVHVPFCGHAVIAAMAGSAIEAPDPLGPRLAYQQPRERVRQFHRQLIDEMAAFFGTA
ncbi:MAG: class II histone deacetylase [Alphaproteobacteria bacterium]